MLERFFQKRRLRIYAAVANEIEKYKNNNLAFMFKGENDQSIVYDQWASIASDLKNGLSRLRAHIYEVREEYSALVIKYDKKVHAFIVLSFTVGRHNRSHPWDVKHNITQYPIGGRSDKCRNDAALNIIDNHHLHGDVAASFL